MIYEIAFLKSVLKEWEKLSPQLKMQFLIQNTITIGKREKSDVYHAVRDRLS